ncbi:MAG: hypothetical protein JSW38_00825 [Dehalococcoidia bacterium]|nr:MAG: hypothetical protein JSW38_00825 [Dehalococcoidia bacterium]
MKKRATLLTLVFILVFSLPGSGCGKDTSEVISVESPYEDVNWDTWMQLKCNMHTHTTESDGIDDPDDVIAAYNDLGYTVLALTDHDLGVVYNPDTTWPWSRWGKDPQTLGMIGIEGNELTQFHKHHFVSLYSDYASTGSTDEGDWLNDIQELDGLAYICHPYWHVDCDIPLYLLDKGLAWYEEILSTYPSLLGIEVYNGGSRSESRYDTDYNLELWDDILVDLLDERQVWGFASDDLHEPNDINKGYCVLLVDQVSDEKVREAIVEGRFYFSHRYIDGPPCPQISSININEESGTITIEATDYDGIKWISGGVEVGEGEIFQYGGNQDVNGYVRMMLSNGTSSTGTQAIKIK